MPDQPLTLLFDGKCPVCAREVAFLTRKDKGRGRLAFRDITAPGFDPAAFGVTHDDLMSKIHAVTPDGLVVAGVEVFRQAYRAIGLGWLIAPTGWPVLKPIADAGYRVFARNRTRWFGRCEDGACAVGGVQAGDSSATR